MKPTVSTNTILSPLTVTALCLGWRVVKYSSPTGLLSPVMALKRVVFPALA